MEGHQARILAEVTADSARALIEAMGMHAENQKRIATGESPAYSEEQFIDVINSNNIGYNDVILRCREI